MKKLSLFDSMFLVLDNKEQKMHVVALCLFEKPKACPDSYIKDLLKEMRLNPWPLPRSNDKLLRSYRTMGRYFWVPDEEMNMEHHVKLEQCPGKGLNRDLLEYAANYQREFLDYDHPLWELRIIDGMEDSNLFAILMKVHHCAIDGVSAMNMMDELFKINASDLSNPDMESKKQAQKSRIKYTPSKSRWERFLAYTLGMKEIISKVIQGQSSIMSPVGAVPKTRFEGIVDTTRSFGTVSIPLLEVKAMSAATGSTVNDVISALVGTALKRYLDELEEPLDKSLYASMPMSLHTDGDMDEPNKIYTCCYPLASDVEGAAYKIELIKEKTMAAKEEIKSLPQSALTTWLGIGIGIILVKKLLGIRGMNPNGYTNLMISNVPSFSEQRYYKGSKLLGFYPLSLVMDGMGINITVCSYAGNLDFGVTTTKTMAPDIDVICGHMTAVMDEMKYELLESTRKAV